MTAILELSQDQVRTQLVNWKEAKYGNGKVELLINPNEL